MAIGDSVTVAVLAGGRSLRMGKNKSFVALQGRPLIQRVLERVALLSLPTILIANAVEDYQSFGLPVFPDVLPGKGSLGGIYTALHYSQTEVVLCVACDMPFLNPELLRYLGSLHEGYDAVVPCVNDRPQGLHAHYRRDCMHSLWQALEHDQLKIGKYLDQIRVRYVEEGDLRRFDPDLRSFINLNTPDDLLRAEQGLEGT